MNAPTFHAAYLVGQPHGPRVPVELAQVYGLLLDHALRPQAADTLALAGVLAQAYVEFGRGCLPLLGVDARSTQQALARCFPGVDRALGLDWQQLQGAERKEPRRAEVDDVVTLLLEHANPDAGLAEHALVIASALGGASLGQNHLWQDLLLPSRGELSALMQHWFPELVRLNHQDMRWKKFLYRQLCLREEILICRSPSCSACSDFANCFGPETGVAVRIWDTAKITDLWPGALQREALNTAADGG